MFMLDTFNYVLFLILKALNTMLFSSLVVLFNNGNKLVRYVLFWGTIKGARTE